MSRGHRRLEKGKQSQYIKRHYRHYGIDPNRRAEDHPRDHAVTKKTRLKPLCSVVAALAEGCTYSLCWDTREDSHLAEYCSSTLTCT
jgi:hypothetical protein